VAALQFLSFVSKYNTNMKFKGERFVASFLNIPIICAKTVLSTEKYKYLLTQEELSDILTERLLGELRPDRQKCDEAGDCGDIFFFEKCR